MSSLSTLDAWCRRLRPRRARIKWQVAGGAAGDAGKLSVFSYVDRDGKVDDYVIHYLKQPGKQLGISYGQNTCFSSDDRFTLK
ncbi:MAG: hypothetical protein O7G83_12655 [Proteobacteria bacterium]|nr:hypothetical protein [Pseudomonadota bacterium]